MEITSVEIKSSPKAGNFKHLVLSDGREVNVFSSHSRYNEMNEGRAISDMELEQKGKYWNLKDSSTRFYGSKPTKSENIERAVIHRDLGIKTSSTARDATLILTTLFPQSDNWQKDWKNIRKYLWENYEHQDEEIPF